MIYPGCSDPSIAYNVTDHIWAASGSGDKQSLVIEEFVDLVDSDPTVSWDTGQNCVVRNGECVLNSTRIRSVPVIPPDQVTGSGANLNAPINSFTGVFVEKVSCSSSSPHKAGPPGHWNVYVRLMPLVGLAPGTPVPPGSGPLSRAIRLIQ